MKPNRTAAVLAAGLALGVAQTATAQSTSSREAALADLTPENSVLVYVDFNTGLDNFLTTVPGPQLRENVRAFTKIGLAFGAMPIALFGDENEYFGPYYPEIDPLRSRSQRFLRTTPTGYTPEFAEWLRKTGRRNIVIGGFSIDNCTLHTSLDLLRNGYNVFVLTDVSPTNNPMAYEAAFTRLVQAGAVPMTWITLATDLVGDWASPAGERVMPILAQHLSGSTVGTPLDTSPDGHGFQPSSGSAAQRR